MEARVVDFPEPVGPVTRTRPWEAVQILSRTLGRLSSSNPGGTFGRRRIAIAQLPCCLCRLHRNRPSPGRVRAKSTEPWARSACRRSRGRRSPQRVRASASLRRSPIGARLPWTLVIGGFPAAIRRSEAPATRAIPSSRPISSRSSNPAAGSSQPVGLCRASAGVTAGVSRSSGASGAPALSDGDARSGSVPRAASFKRRISLSRSGSG